MLFEEFEAIFGEPKVEWSSGGGHPLRRLLYYVHAPDPSHLRIHVTDFHSNTWEAIRSVHQLEDMRDNIGIGRSWSEFIDYFVASIKSEDVKVVLHGQSDSGATSAKLVAQKAKGMPLIFVTLVKLVDFAAREVMGNLSMQLFMAFKNTHTSLAFLDRKCSAWILEEARCSVRTSRSYYLEEIPSMANTLERIMFKYIELCVDMRRGDLPRMFKYIELYVQVHGKCR
ncbi:uncharacterized protein LOC115667135 isoform X3 [Syzygium oleosum]|uniref:uncharacterized protein LOC115667135 isoform X3 n=1 Tax=Syzygium oleosum TaxID=219896 RepID=UPI0024BB56BF|nr:uncharacterized protein LOC115667135 isoform X3 [Syzygium oleosum]